MRKDATRFQNIVLNVPTTSRSKNVTSADVLLNFQWYFIPVIFFIILVLAFVFVGDGLRDAADPYST